MRLAGYINSTLGWEHVQHEGKSLLNSGCSLIIWPEGHRSRNGKLGRFKNGAFQLALITGRPLVPVCITGSRQMLQPGNRFLTPARIKVTLLPPIQPTGSYDNHDDIKSLKEKTKNAIAVELTNKHSAEMEDQRP
jgi:1-acyl-sn-glycerol-3-phosphate acyltransferase